MTRCVDTRSVMEHRVRINVDRRPTRDELREMVERPGLSVVWLDVPAAPPAT